MNRTIDRISGLPDEILTRILSFVSTKEAVQTCILAKRWRNVWASVPVLYFHLKQFSKIKNDDEDYDDDEDTGGSDDDEDWRISEDWFMRFVDGVVQNRGTSHLDKVVYFWRYGSVEDALKFDCTPSLDWLNHVALLMPRVILVYIQRSQSVELPDSVFLCTSLQTLMMNLYSDVTTFLTPKSINLPSLKTLELECVHFGDNFVYKLFLGCPNLETMRLENCGLNISAISSNMLKMLTLNDCEQHQPLQISCPALVSLSIDNSYQGESISLQNMTSLVNADIRFLARDNNLPIPTPNIVSGCSNASSIKVYVSSLVLKEQLDKDIPNYKMFGNLKNLEIGLWDMINNIDLVACFLESSPNLQMLTLWLRKEQADASEEPKREVVGNHLFKLEYLETLKIICWNEEYAGNLVKSLGRYIKTIGNIIVDTKVY